MDVILRNARRIGAEHELTDIGVADGRIAAIAPGLAAECETIDVGGRLVSPGFVETHIHLDKSCILNRCKAERGDLKEAIAEAAKAKTAFTPEDVYGRAMRTLEKAILHGTTHMRTHLEVDPGVGLRGLEGVLPLVKQYAWAIDLQICVFPQEGLLNNPGTEELMIEALDRGCRAVGGAPYTDSDPPGQIDRIFELAREYDIDVDLHLDFGPNAEGMTLDHVCKRAREFRYGGRVAVGHVTRATSLSMPAFEAMAKRLADAGVALTVLPSTDLYLMGRDHRHDHNVTRGVVPAHKLPASRRKLLAVEQQYPQSVHAVRRLLADADGQSLRQCLPGRNGRRHARVLRYGHAAAGRNDAACRLRAYGRQIRRSCGA